MYFRRAIECFETRKNNLFSQWSDLASSRISRAAQKKKKKRGHDVVINAYLNYSSSEAAGHWFVHWIITFTVRSARLTRAVHKFFGGAERTDRIRGARDKRKMRYFANVLQYVQRNNFSMTLSATKLVCTKKIKKVGTRKYVIIETAKTV